MHSVATNYCTFPINLQMVDLLFFYSKFLKNLFFVPDCFKLSLYFVLISTLNSLILSLCAMRSQCEISFVSSVPVSTLIT